MVLGPYSKEHPKCIFPSPWRSLCLNRIPTFPSVQNFGESPEMRTLRYKVMGPYSKLLEMWGLDPTTMATTKIVPKSERRKISEEWERLYGPEAERWNEQKRKTNNFGLPEKLTPDMKTLLFRVPEEVNRFKR